MDENEDGEIDYEEHQDKTTKNRSFWNLGIGRESAAVNAVPLAVPCRRYQRFTGFSHLCSSQYFPLGEGRVTRFLFIVGSSWFWPLVLLSVAGRKGLDAD